MSAHPDITNGPGDGLTDTLADELIRAFRRLRRSERRELSPLGLTFGQARALRVVAESGGGMRIGELAGVLEIVPRSATTMVDALEAAGLAVRRPDPADRRSVLVVCSEQGGLLLERLAQTRAASAARLFAPLTDGDRLQLLRLLQATTEDRS